MSVVALKPYEFQPRDRAEVFGDDMLVHVYWKGTMLFCAAAAFRAPKAMKFGDFLKNMVAGVFGLDPSFGELTLQNTRWYLGNEIIQPTEEMSLAELGVTHKGLLKFEKAG